MFLVDAEIPTIMPEIIISGSVKSAAAPPAYAPITPEFVAIPNIIINILAARIAVGIIQIFFINTLTQILPLFFKKVYDVAVTPSA